MADSVQGRVTLTKITNTASEKSNKKFTQKGQGTVIFTKKDGTLSNPTPCMVQRTLGAKLPDGTFEKKMLSQDQLGETFDCYISIVDQTIFAEISLAVKADADALAALKELGL
jgi:hypothetical protein